MYSLEDLENLINVNISKEINNIFTCLVGTVQKVNRDEGTVNVKIDAPNKEINQLKNVIDTFDFPTLEDVPYYSFPFISQSVSENDKVLLFFLKSSAEKGEYAQHSINNNFAINFSQVVIPEENKIKVDNGTNNLKDVLDLLSDAINYLTDFNKVLSGLDFSLSAPNGPVSGTITVNLGNFTQATELQNKISTIKDKLNNLLEGH